MRKSAGRPGTRARIEGVPTLGKSGTTSSYRDAWFIGFTEQYVTGVWMGYDDNTPLQGVTGGGLPAEIWQAVMAEIHEGLPPQPLGVIAPDAAGNMIVASDIVSADSDDPLAAALAEEFDFRYLVGVVSVMADKDVDGILAALEPAFDQIVVTHNGSPRAMDVETLAALANERFGPERVLTAASLADAIEAAIGLVEESADEGMSGSGIVITGSVMTAGAARTLFGRDPS